MAGEIETDPSLRILFVEDAAADVEQAETALRKEGLVFTSQRVDTKDALLQALNQFRPDLVLSGYALPAFDGLQALGITQAHDPDLPFILLTGSVGEETAVECMKAGATDYVLKSRMLRLPFAVKEALAKRGQRLARQRAEEALLESRNRFQALVETTGDFIWEMDARGVYTYCSPQLDTLWGLQPQEMIGKSPFDLLPPEDAEQALSSFRALLASASPFKDLETRSFDGAGQVRWLEVNGVPFFAADGRLAGYRGTTRDVTHRKLAEDALRDSEEDYRGLFQNATLGIFHSLPEGRFLRVNPALARMLGYESPEEIVSTITDIGAQIYVDSKQRSDILSDAQAHRGWVYAENRYRRKDGTILTANLSIRTVLNANGTVAYLEGFVEDITARARAQEALLLSEGAARRTAETLQMVNRMATAVATGLDLERLMQTLHDQCRQIGDVDTFYIALYDESTGMLTFPYNIKDGERRTLPARHMTENPGLAGHVIRHRQALYVPDMSNWPSDLPPIVRQPGTPTQSFIGAPLILDARVVGVLSMQSHSPNAYTAGQIQTLELLATQVAIAIRNSQLYAQVKTELAERKRAEESLRESEERFRAIAANSPDHIIVQDGDLRYTLVVNPQLGLTEADMLGKTDGEIFRNEDGERLTAIKRKVLETGESLHLELPLKNLKGEPEFFDGSYAPKFDSTGRADGVIGYFRNVTVLKQAEAAERDQRQLAEALCETAAALNRYLDLDQVLDTILDNVSRVVPYDAGEVLLLSLNGRVRDARHRGYFERGLEEWASNRDYPLSYFPIFTRIAETRQPAVVSDTRGDPDWVPAPEAHWVRSFVCAPILGKDRVAGFISLCSDESDTYMLEHARRLGAFADQAAVALENAGLFAQLRAGREQLRVLSRRLLAAQEVERRRVARELHDEVGQLLTGLNLSLQMTAAGASAAQRQGMTEATALVSELMSRVRQLSLDLRPAMLDDLGLLPALLWHLQRFSQQTHVAIDFQHAGIEAHRFSPEIETAAYRIVQEALTNVARHGGVAKATVRVWGDPDSLSVQVEDLGAGFDFEALSAEGKTSGLTGIRERVALLGGRLDLETAPGQGVHLTAVLPLAEPAKRRAARR